MDKEKALKNQGSEFREDMAVWGGDCKSSMFSNYALDRMECARY